MAWAFSVVSNIPTLTQTGTDGNLLGISNAITAVPTVARNTAYTTSQLVKPPTPTGLWYRCSTAGTTAATAPTYGTTEDGTTTDGTAVFTAFFAPDQRNIIGGNMYYMPGVDILVNGTLTNPNPAQGTFAGRRLIVSGTFTSGTWASDGVTPLNNGVHFMSLRPDGQGAGAPGDLTVASGGVTTTGNVTFIGGELHLTAAWTIQSGAQNKYYYTRFRSGRVARFRNQSSLTVLRECEFYNVSFDRFASAAEFTVKSRAAEYVFQYIGSAILGTDAKFTASAIENIGGTNAVDNYTAGWVELYNCGVNGPNLGIITHPTNNSYRTAMAVALYQDVQITARDTAGAVVQNVRFSTTDNATSSPNRTITTLDGLKTWDVRGAQTYQATSNASGVASLTPMSTFWYVNGFVQAAGSFVQRNQRFPSNTATFEGRAYNYKTTTVSAVLGATTVQALSAGMIGLDTATTVSEATALANSNITISGTSFSTVVVAVSGNSTYQDIWNKYRAYISQFANFGIADNWTCVAGQLNMGASSLLVYPGVTLSSSTGVTYAYADTVQVLNMTNAPYLFNAGGVLQATGVLLPTIVLGTQPTYSGTGQITGIYGSTAGVSTVLELRGVKNNAAYVLANNATKATILYGINSTGTTQTYTAYFPPGSAGTQVYVARQFYGDQFDYEVITLAEGGMWYQFVDIPDEGITQTTLATVLAYTTLETTNKLYDYIAAFRRTEQGIKLSGIVTRAGPILQFGDYSGVVNQSAASVFSITGTTITLKANGLAGTNTYTTIVATPPATWVANTNEVIDVEIEDANGNSSVTIDASGVSTFEIWKITDATPPDQYATGTLLATVGIGKYRFLSANGFKMVIRDTTTNFRVVSEMEKGTYEAALFFGADVQLAQAPDVTIIKNNLATMQLDVDAIKGTGFVKDTHSLTNIKKKAALAAALSA